MRILCTVHSKLLPICAYLCIYEPLGKGSDPLILVSDVYGVTCVSPMAAVSDRTIYQLIIVSSIDSIAFQNEFARRQERPFAATRRRRGRERATLRFAGSDEGTEVRIFFACLKMWVLIQLLFSNGYAKTQLSAIGHPLQAVEDAVSTFCFWDEVVRIERSERYPMGRSAWLVSLEKHGSHVCQETMLFSDILPLFSTYSKRFVKS